MPRSNVLEGAIHLEQASGETATRGGADRRLAEAGSPRAIALALAILLPLYMGLTFGYRDSIPLFEAPDEPSHLHYAVFLYDEGRLPRHDPPEVPGEGMQPPLVYAIAAPLLGTTGVDVAHARAALAAMGRAIYHGEPLDPESRALAFAARGPRQFSSDGSLAGLRILRGVNLAFGLLAVTFTFAAVWRVGRDARLAVLAAALLAFNPQFLFISATLSNDTAAAAVGAAALWIVLRTLEEGGPSRHHYVSGAVLIALGVLTKLSTLPGLAVAAGTIVAIDRRPQRDRRLDLALAAGLVALLAGPYLAWSAEHRAGLLAVDTLAATSGFIPGPEDVGGRLAYFMQVYWGWTFESYWARFGWLGLRAPNPVYLVFFALTWTGLLGYYAGRVPEPNALLRERTLHVYLVMTIATALFAHAALNVLVTAPDGRALFAVAPQIGLLLALGLGRLLGYENRTLPLTVAVIACLIALDLYCLRGVLIPAYASP